MQEFLKLIDPQKRRIILGLLLLGIVLLAVSTILGGGSPSSSGEARPAAPSPTVVAADPLAAWQAATDQTLARLLSEVAGAGEVSVSVTLASSPARTLAENVTVRDSSERSSQSGGTTLSQTSETDRQVVFSGNNTPVVLNELGPKVVGVLVVAAGAGDPVVREELTSAVETLLGVPAYKVLVLPKEGKR